MRIRNVLTRLRQAVGEVVQRDGDRVLLAPGVKVDARLFLEEADAALAASAGDEATAARRGAEALRWYAGPMLPEAVYEPWAEGPRDRLHRRYLQLLDLLAAHAERNDRCDDAARYLELAIEADPFDHDRYVAAAEVRLRQGRPSSALHLVRRARERADELGVPAPVRLDEVEVAALA